MVEEDVDVGRRGGGGENPVAGAERAAGAGAGGDNPNTYPKISIQLHFYVGRGRKKQLCNLTIYANNVYYCLHIL